MGHVYCATQIDTRNIAGCSKYKLWREENKVVAQMSLRDVTGCSKYHFEMSMVAQIVNSFAKWMKKENNHFWSRFDTLMLSREKCYQYVW